MAEPTISLQSPIGNVTDPSFGVVTPTPMDDGDGRSETSSTLPGTPLMEGVGELEEIDESQLYAHLFGVACAQNPRYRRTMEDAHFKCSPFNGNPNQHLFGVLDGHGGDTAANISETMIPEIMKSKVSELDEINEKNMENAFTECFHEIDNELVTRGVMSPGTTVVCTFIDTLEDGSRVIYAAGAGDSRVILCHGDGTTSQLTIDHKGSCEKEVARIKDLGGFVAGNRVNGILAVTRSIGDLLMKEFVISTPECSCTMVNDNDIWLILACDGMTDVIDNQLAYDLIKNCDTAQEAADILLTKSIQMKSTDNVTVMVYKLN